MSSIVDRALRLWTLPIPAGDSGLESFRAVYADPLNVNGQSTPLEVLVDRARMLQAAVDDIRADVQHQLSAPGGEAFAFRLSGRHVGPLQTPLGELPPTGRTVSWSGMDIFLVDEEADRISAVWALSDFLGLLMDAEAVTLRP